MIFNSHTDSHPMHQGSKRRQAKPKPKSRAIPKPANGATLEEKCAWMRERQARKRGGKA